MPKYCYFPILKTTDAELKAYSFLNEEVKDGILPIFELTRSRRSKQNPNAIVSKRIDKIKEFAGNRKFILDLTIERTLSNVEIEDMLNMPQNGFKLWVSFIKELIEQGLDVIPMIHFDPSELPEVRREINALSEVSPYLAFRVGISEQEASDYIDEISSVYDLSKLILILDGGFIESNNISSNLLRLLDYMNDNFSDNMPKAIICTFSSFPPAVNKAHYGEYYNGNFPILEVSVSNQLSQQYNFILHGDYGSVHPQRYETGGGTWIPRIDFTNSDTFFYHRRKREEGGYPEAARHVVSDSNYRRINEFDTWGDQEILVAAQNTPNGRSPSHWIAVRINLFITKQYLRFKNNACISL